MGEAVVRYTDARGRQQTATLGDWLREQVVCRPHIDDNVRNLGGTVAGLCALLVRKGLLTAAEVIDAADMTGYAEEVPHDRDR